MTNVNASRLSQRLTADANDPAPGAPPGFPTLCEAKIEAEPNPTKNEKKKIQTDCFYELAEVK